MGLLRCALQYGDDGLARCGIGGRHAGIPVVQFLRAQQQIGGRRERDQRRHGVHREGRRHGTGRVVEHPGKVGLETDIALGQQGQVAGRHGGLPAAIGLHHGKPGLGFQGSRHGRKASAAWVDLDMDAVAHREVEAAGGAGQIIGDLAGQQQGCGAFAGIEFAVGGQVGGPDHDRSDGLDDQLAAGDIGLGGAVAFRHDAHRNVVHTLAQALRNLLSLLCQVQAPKPGAAVIRQRPVVGHIWCQNQGVNFRCDRDAELVFVFQHKVLGLPRHRHRLEGLAGQGGLCFVGLEGLHRRCVWRCQAHFEDIGRCHQRCASQVACRVADDHINGVVAAVHEVLQIKARHIHLPLTIGSEGGVGLLVQYHHHGLIVFCRGGATQAPLRRAQSQCCFVFGLVEYVVGIGRYRGTIGQWCGHGQIGDHGVNAHIACAHCDIARQIGERDRDGAGIDLALR